jgi:hypothetical protein
VIRGFVEEEARGVLLRDPGCATKLDNEDQLYEILTNVRVRLVDKVLSVGIVVVFRGGNLVAGTTNQIARVYELDGCPYLMKEILSAGYKCKLTPSYFSEENQKNAITEEIPGTGFVAVSFYYKLDSKKEDNKGPGAWWRIVFLPMGKECMARSAEDLSKEYFRERPKCP